MAESEDIECYVKAKAPVNIALVKYWGKVDEALKIPLNDSLSGTLSIEDMCTTTSVFVSKNFSEDRLTLNGQDQSLSDVKNSPVTRMIEDMRKSSGACYSSCKVKIVTENNFPTAAGLASSASGYACLAFALGHVYGVSDTGRLSRIARKASGSACRSMYGGFVHWVKGHDDESSFAYQVADHHHWPDMRVLICVIGDDQKDVPSTSGMKRSVCSSALISHRASQIVPNRISELKDAIKDRNFEKFADITMKDSNQFHAICLDTFPPIMYLNETSKQIIKICTAINQYYGVNKVAYTFDAGPNACIYLLDDYLPELILVLEKFFPVSGELEIRGRPDPTLPKSEEVQDLIDHISSFARITPMGIKYLISTSIGEGPKLMELSKK